MNVIQTAVQSALTPSAVRVAVQRLRTWLPAGPVAVLGDDAPGLVRGLRQAGFAVQGAADGKTAAAGVIVIEHADAAEPGARLRPLLAELSGPVCLVVAGDAAATANRAAWEAAVIKAEWRKHPLNERVAPYGELDRITGLLMIAFERVPDQAILKYPLKALEEERDLHTDMTREPGRRSDAHMTRYSQAAQFIRPGDRVVDVACGLGYGSYQLAHNSLAASFTGLDASDYAVDYANTNFAPVSPAPMKFVVGDAQHLSEMADGSAEFAVSVETLEHLPEPDRLLAELHRVLSPQGRVYASVPNDWSDETGEDPNPFHFHVYDWPRLLPSFSATVSSSRRPGCRTLAAARSGICQHARCWRSIRWRGRLAMANGCWSSRGRRMRQDRVGTTFFNTAMLCLPMVTAARHWRSWKANFPLPTRCAARVRR